MARSPAYGLWQQSTTTAPPPPSARLDSILGVTAGATCSSPRSQNGCKPAATHAFVVRHPHTILSRRFRVEHHKRACVGPVTTWD